MRLAVGAFIGLMGVWIARTPAGFSWDRGMGFLLMAIGALILVVPSGQISGTQRGRR